MTTGTEGIGWHCTDHLTTVCPADCPNTKDLPRGTGSKPANTLSTVVRGRMAVCDVVFHQGMKDQANVFPNLILLVKLEDAQMLDSDAQIPSGTPPDGQIVQVTFTMEW